jgi:GNAT superfamily N-acetyltransferase
MVILLFRKNLTSSVFFESNLPIEFRFINPHEFSIILDLKHLTEIEIKNRFNNQELCLGAFYDNKLVGYHWCCFKDIYYPTFNYHHKLDDFSASLGPVFVDPDYRGNNIRTALETQWFLYLADHGYKYCETIIWAYNKASLKVIDKVEYKALRKITTIKLFNRFVLKHTIEDL